MKFVFPQTHNPWVDAGIVGFQRFSGNDLPDSLTMRLLPEGLQLEGEQAALKDFLERQFNRLVEEWYNASNAKQREDKANYYFDPQTKTFHRFGRSSPKGLTALLFEAPARNYQGPQWYRKEKKDKSGMQTSRVDPVEARQWAQKNDIEEDLQELLDNFLQQSGLWPEGKPRPASSTQVLLWGRRNLRVPDVVCWADDQKPQGRCSISGKPSGKLLDIDGKTFPFTVGKSGHVNFSPQWSGTEKVGWKTVYIALFAPVIGFWKGGHGRPHLIGALPVAENLATLKANCDFLRPLFHDDPTLMGNFTIGLSALKYPKKPEEYYIAFYEQIFQISLRGQQQSQIEQAESYDMDILPAKIEQGIPTAFLLMEAQKSSKWDIKEAVVYQDPLYLLRLFGRMFVFDPERAKREPQKENGETQDHWLGVQLNFNRLLQQLRDRSKPDKGGQDVLTRAVVLRHILAKKPVLKQLLSHAFSVNKSKRSSISEIVKFAHIYQPLFWSKEMSKQQEQFLQAAKQLGERIAIVIYEYDNGRKNRLYKLRRALKLQSFLREINTLQERFGLTVPEAIGTGLLGHHNFEEFRGFCLLNALNKFNQISYAKSRITEGESS